jgi:hypothetical protein
MNMGQSKKKEKKEKSVTAKQTSPLIVMRARASIYAILQNHERNRNGSKIRA